MEYAFWKNPSFTFCFMHLKSSSPYIVFEEKDKQRERLEKTMYVCDCVTVCIEKQTKNQIFLENKN